MNVQINGRFHVSGAAARPRAMQALQVGDGGRRAVGAGAVMRMGEVGN
jgi:hypothetical protein